MHPFRWGIWEEENLTQVCFLCKTIHSSLVRYHHWPPSMWVTFHKTIFDLVSYSLKISYITIQLSITFISLHLPFFRSPHHHLSLPISCPPFINFLLILLIQLVLLIYIWALIFRKQFGHGTIMKSLKRSPLWLMTSKSCVFKTMFTVSIRLSFPPAEQAPDPIRKAVAVL